MYRCVALLALASPGTPAERARARGQHRAGRAGAAGRPRRERADPLAGGIRGGLPRGRRPGCARRSRVRPARADRTRRLGGRGPGHRHGRRARRRAEGVPHRRSRRSARAGGPSSWEPTSTRCSPSRRCATSATSRASTARSRPPRTRSCWTRPGLTLDEVVDASRRLPARPPPLFDRVAPVLEPGTAGGGHTDRC